MFLDFWKITKTRHRIQEAYSCEWQTFLWANKRSSTQKKIAWLKSSETAKSQRIKKQITSVESRSNSY